MIFLIPPVKVNSIIAIYRNTAISEKNYGYNLSIWKTQITLYIIFRVHYILLPYLSWSFFESIFLPLQKEKKMKTLIRCLLPWRPEAPTLKQTKQEITLHWPEPPARVVSSWRDRIQPAALTGLGERCLNWSRDWGVGRKKSLNWTWN